MGPSTPSTHPTPAFKTDFSSKEVFPSFKMPVPCDMCRSTPGKYHFDGDLVKCPGCDGKTETNINLSTLIQEVIPVLWDIKPKMTKTNYRLSYGSKARVEEFLQLYISNDQFIQAALEMKIPHIAGKPNYLFAITPKFPTEWIQLSGRLTKRPLGARKKEWEAYQEAYKWLDGKRADYEEWVNEQQEHNREWEMNLDHPIMKLQTQDEKVRYILRRA